VVEHLPSWCKSYLQSPALQINKQIKKNLFNLALVGEVKTMAGRLGVP
jgi:hypothetical protein